MVVAQASAEAAALESVRTQAANQFKVLDSQLASKYAELAAAEVRLQALQMELQGTSSKVCYTHK